MRHASIVVGGGSPDELLRPARNIHHRHTHTLSCSCAAASSDVNGTFAWGTLHPHFYFVYCLEAVVLQA